MCFAYLCWLCDLSLYLRTFYFSLELLEMQHWPSSKVISGQWMWWRSRSVFVMIETGNIIMPSSLPRRHFQRSSFFIPPLKHLPTEDNIPFPSLANHIILTFQILESWPWPQGNLIITRSAWNTWKAFWPLINDRFRAAKVRFSQYLRIFHALHNLSERKKRRKTVTLRSCFSRV